MEYVFLFLGLLLITLTTLMVGSENKSEITSCILTLLMISSVFFASGDIIGEKKVKSYYLKEENDSILINNTVKELAFEDSVYNYIKFLNIKHPDIVFKQARIESGNFKSKIFKENNNIFGMKVPNKRPNIINGSNLGYATYNNWKESVIDYALYQIYSAKGMNREEYIQHLGSNYAEDPYYSKKVR